MVSVFEQALEIKEFVGNYAPEEDDGGPVEQDNWLAMPNEQFTTRSVSRTVIDTDAALSHDQWFELGCPHLEYTNTMYDSIKGWVAGLSVQELANILTEVPHSVNNHREGFEHEELFNFTPMQRLYIFAACARPYPVSATVLCTSENIQRIQYPIVIPPNARRRKQIYQQKSMMAGDIPEHIIVSLATYSGKTAIALAMALYLTTNKYEQLVETHKRRMSGLPMCGPDTPFVTRVVLVCAPSGTLQHFVDTSKGLLEAWKQSHFGFEYKLWTSAGHARTNLESASEMENTVVFWFVPPEKLYEVLKYDTRYVVSVCIYDEFPPNFRNDSAISPIVCNIINQATLNLWDRTGGSSILGRKLFGSKLSAPSNIAEYIRNSSFSYANQAMQQMCTMAVVESGNLFRIGIRRDLHLLVPASLRIVNIKSRRRCIASAIADAHTDLVPVTVSSSITNHLVSSCHRRTHIFDAIGIADLKRFLDDQANLTPAIILQSLDYIRANPAATARQMEEYQAEIDVIKDRLRTRIEDFLTDDCPICCNPVADNAFCVMNCCGLFMCGDCRHQCESRNNKCPQCRAPIKHGFAAEEMFPEFADAPQPDAVEDPDYPSFPIGVVRMPLSAGSEECLLQLLRDRTIFSNSQIANAVITLQSLRSCGYVRPLIICEEIAHGGRHLLNLAKIQENTDYIIHDITETFSGRGTKFVKFKEMFDNPQTPPTALLCIGATDKFLVGTNFDYADCLVSIGRIPQRVLRQAFGRVFRPRSSRDNDLAIPFVNVKF